MIEVTLSKPAWPSLNTIALRGAEKLASHITTVIEILEERVEAESQKPRPKAPRRSSAAKKR